MRILILIALLFLGCKKETQILPPPTVTVPAPGGSTITGTITETGVIPNFNPVGHTGILVNYSDSFQIFFFIPDREYVKYKFKTGDKYASPKGCFKVTNSTFSTLYEQHFYNNGRYNCAMLRKAGRTMSIIQILCY